MEGDDVNDQQLDPRKRDSSDSRDERRVRVLTREAARRRIVEAANALHRQNGGRGERYSMRTIQRAVAVARRNRLVPDRVLEAAGFRATRPRPDRV